MSFTHTYYYRVLPMALLMVLITACSGSDGFSDSTDTEVNGTPIAFSCNEQEVTRADNSTVLSDYIRDFMVYGIKKSTKNEVVFDNYIVWYSTNVSSTNKNNWEYAGTFAGCPSGDDVNKWSDWTNYKEVYDNYGDQKVKYWDYNTDHYLFWAIGKTDKLHRDISDFGFITDASTGEVEKLEFNETMETISDDNKCLYYTAPVYVSASNYGQPVELKFNRFRSKIRVGFYEDLKYNNASDAASKRRYQVKDLQFYQPDEATGEFATTTGNDVYMKGCFVQDASVNFAYTNTSTPGVDITLEPVEDGDSQFGNVGEITLTEALSSSSSAPQWTKADGAYTIVMPNTNTDKYATGPLTILCKYTVVDTETDAELHEEDKLINSVQAVVPAEYTKWEPNHSYTYLFKITDMNKITLTDVQVQDWGQGESTSQNWHNW